VRHQICDSCGDHTGRCQEDEMRIDDEVLCEGCYAERLCNLCHGEGTYPIMRNARGEVDYINGTPSGENAGCDQCNGEGYV